MNNISEHITYAEATHTDRAIKNTPDFTQLANMGYVSETIFEPLRAYLGGKAIDINSFFRSTAVNKAVGGSDTSQHVLGLAMDLDAADGTGINNRDILFAILHLGGYDQVIAEFPDAHGVPAWVHVSARRNGNRGQVLVSYKSKGSTHYKPFEA